MLHLVFMMLHLIFHYIIWLWFILKFKFIVYSLICLQFVYWYVYTCIFMNIFWLSNYAPLDGLYVSISSVSTMYPNDFKSAWPSVILSVFGFTHFYWYFGTYRGMKMRCTRITHQSLEFAQPLLYINIVIPYYLLLLAKKKPSYFPSYVLFNSDPLNCLLQSPLNWVIFSPI